SKRDWSSDVCSSDLEDIYGGTYRFLEHYERHYSIQTSYDDFTNMKTVEQKITDNTQAILIETPTNPLMQEIDITRVADLCNRYKIGRASCRERDEKE